MIDQEYGKARDNAKNILLFAWKTFDEKTEKTFNTLTEKPFSDVVPIGENSKEIDTEKIINKLKTVKKEIGEEINKIIEKEFFNEEKEDYFEEDLEWIENRVKNAKKVGVNWFDSFIIKTGIPQKRLEDIMFLWRNFRNQNLWIRYNKEPNFRSCKEKGQIIDWLETNDNHLLSCFHEAIFTIVLMRNVSEHLATNHYAKVFLGKLNETVKDPLTDLEKSLFNSYTYFISMTNMITGLLRSLQIFEESIKIASVNGIDESELPRNTEYTMECPKCKKEFWVTFEPDEGRRINCRICKQDFSFKLEYAR
ncbi:MAG: PHD finger domain-containing protein [Nitrosotalea sp.]